MRRRASIPALLWLALSVVTIAWSADQATSDAELGAGDRRPRQAMVANVHLPGFGADIVVLHDYGVMSLVQVGNLRSDGRGILHVLPDPGRVSFRGWSDTVAAPAAENGGMGVHVANLIGPLDERWRSRIEAAGLEILAPAHPHALVVRGTGAGLHRVAALTTSTGRRVVLGARPLPMEARVHRSLTPALDGRALAVEGLDLRGYGGRDLPRRVEDSIKHSSANGDLRGLLTRYSEIGYAEPAFEIGLHNNLVARAPLTGVEEMWELGFDGSGVVVLHNDSGVDLGHPDLTGAVVGSVGRMAYADTAHGTHTAGSIVGRGSVTTPANGSSCDDVFQGLERVRGMAPGATLLTNNIFVDGFNEISEMMAWGVAQGAHLSSNSWGLLGHTGPVVGYSAAAARADAAVRDADPEEPGSQPLAIFFSAGNTGPEHGTVTSPGTAKNVITVGATQNARCGAWVPSQQGGPDPSAVLVSSGRGPSQGRIKPDVVAPGSDVLSLESGDEYSEQLWDQPWTGSELALNSGTSQACAVAAGAGTVLYEALWRHRGSRPSPALLKAALTIGAEPGLQGVDAHRGWGRVDLEGAVAGLVRGWMTARDQAATAELRTAERWREDIVVRSSSEPLLVAVAWTDVPGEEDADHPLVNDLDVVLTAPTGVVYRGNVFSDGWSTADPGSAGDSANNMEVIRIRDPEPGTWTVEVVGVNVAAPPPGLEGQDFALAYSGDAGPCGEAPPAPLFVTAANDGPNRIRVDWEPVADALRYEISRALTSGGRPYEPVGFTAAGTTFFIDTDVSGGVDYFYVVRAERSCWSGYSEEAAAVASGSCRLAPVFAGLATVESPGGTGCDIRLSWSPARNMCPDPVLYDLYRSTEEDFDPGPETLVTNDIAGLSWLDRGVESGRDHFYLVRARHAGTPLDDGNLEVRGMRPRGPDDVYLWSDAGHPLDGWLRAPGGISDSGTEPWRTTGDDSWSEDRSWFVADEDRVKDQVLATAEPVELPAGAAPRLEFHHRFRLHHGGDGGRLEYSTDGGLRWRDILAGDGQTVPDDEDRWLAGGYTATIGGLENPLYGEEGWTGDSKGWVHSVVDLEALAGRRILLRWRFGGDERPGLGRGWWLDDIRLFVEQECRSCVAPDPPAGMEAAADPDGVALSWPVIDGAVSYRISRSTAAEGPFHLVATVPGSATGYRDGSVSGGIDYTYVLAVDTGCLSGPSPGVTVTAGGPCTLPPFFWGLDGIEDRREPGCALDLRWRQADPGCVGADVRYRVYRSPVSGFEPGPESLIADGVAGPRYRDLTVADSEVAHYRVRAVDGVSGAEDANPVERSGWTTGPQEVHFSDSIEGDLSGWRTGIGSSLDTGTEPWRVDSVASDGDRSWFCAAEPRVKDQVVGLVDAFEIVDPSTILVFDHLFDLEPFWDGGRLEYSTDDGDSWHDILTGNGDGVIDNPDRFLRGGYNGIASPGTGHPFGGQRAWTGFNGVWTEVALALSDFLGERVSLRWRLGCDRSDARIGWWIDRVEIRTTRVCETLAAPSRRGGSVRRR